MQKVASDSFGVERLGFDGRRVNAPGSREPNDSFRIQGEQLAFTQTEHVGAFGISQAAQI